MSITEQYSFEQKKKSVQEAVCLHVCVYETQLEGEENQDRTCPYAVLRGIGRWVGRPHFNFKLFPPSVPLSIIFSPPSLSATAAT